MKKSFHLLSSLFILSLVFACSKEDQKVDPDFAASSHLISHFQSTDDSLHNSKRNWVVEKSAMNTVTIHETVVNIGNGKSFERIYRDVKIKFDGHYFLDFEGSSVDTPSQKVLQGRGEFNPLEPNQFVVQVSILDINTHELLRGYGSGLVFEKIK
ncbi:hypothetical protein [Dyadobacter psychrophilus]|uniref:Gliding motility-associated lipoprotein GldH n=1 Tax=Dyadobacter psychrophilus TaxID=651661 RepID=A0A1T5HAB5_9BACT|nr:hypothetical protein [Dyadobacter psychrophilus]SKC17628.1 hypothetical protein SAMN05660293_05155 [Dyadobacter psychrophilus]